MVSLSCIYGFTQTQWQTLVDVMLEKKKGVRQIHKLQVVGILEADVNTALKVISAKKLTRAAELQDLLHDEQWGSRPKRSAPDAAL